MNILLTGPNSFSGKIVLEKLLEKKHHVTTISRQKLSKNYVGQLQCIYADLAKLDQLEQNFDAVVHIAATSPTIGITSANLINDNLLATQNLIELVKLCSIKKFIFFSTCSVYGDISQSVLSESTPIYNPCSYGASKLMCEALLREQTLFQSVAIRLPAVIGSGATRHWLANTLSKAKANAPITIYNPHALFNNAIHIDTLAQFVENLLNMPLPYEHDYLNVASHDGLFINQIVERITKKIKSRSIVTIGRTKKTPFSISTEYATNKYKFTPTFFSDALDRYLESELA